MSTSKRITVSGQQRTDVDPLVLLQILLAIGENWDQERRTLSTDAFEAAIEDHQETAR
jgi:hypothetical protein